MGPVWVWVWVWLGWYYHNATCGACRGGIRLAKELREEFGIVRVVVTRFFGRGALPLSSL